MLFKLILLFAALILLIFGIYKAADMEGDFDSWDIEEYPAMCVIGGILWAIGLIVTAFDVFGGFNGSALKVGFTFIIGGFTMFVEPFVHYLVIRKK